MWSKHSYHSFKRYIDYFHHDDSVFKYIANLPPIVNHHKIDRLKKELKECEEKKRIVVHSGDCAEPFEHVHKDVLERTYLFSQIKLAFSRN